MFDHCPSSHLIMWLPLFIHAEPTPPTTISTEDLLTTTVSSATDPPTTTRLSSGPHSSTDPPTTTTSPPSTTVTPSLDTSNLKSNLVFLKLQFYARCVNYASRINISIAGLYLSFHCAIHVMLRRLICVAALLNNELVLTKTT